MAEESCWQVRRGRWRGAEERNRQATQQKKTREETCVGEEEKKRLAAVGPSVIGLGCCWAVKWASFWVGLEGQKEKAQ